ncbi:MAG: hypothetical protein OXI43_12125 [Candidatus Poribacteria bacterium]|nr:hypothetical protein [Candidatus Poribacteria bacterium]
MPQQRVPLKKGGQKTQAFGQTRGGFTTKLNLSLSDACIPLRFIFIQGHRNDITQVSALIEGYSYEYVIGDKVSYDSDAFIAEITSRDAIAVSLCAATCIIGWLPIFMCCHTRFSQSQGKRHI